MKTFEGLPLNAEEAFTNIEILLGATEVMFSADNAPLNRIGTMILNAAREYCSAAKDEMIILRSTYIYTMCHH